MPPIGAGVWIEFERGDPDYPIWVGGYWGSAAETPVASTAGPPALDALRVGYRAALLGLAARDVGGGAVQRVHQLQLEGRRPRVAV